MLAPLILALTVLLNGQELKQEPCRLSAMPYNRVWTGRQRALDQTRLASFVTFDLVQPSELEIRGVASDVEPMLYPLSSASALRRAGESLFLRLEAPGQFVLDFPETANLSPLHIFADAPLDVPKAGADVVFFGPGEHDVGVLAPRSNQTVVLDRGAIVYGALFLDHVTNVVVTGHGILDCSRLTRADPRAQAFRISRGLPPVDTEFACHACVVYACENVKLTGFTIRDTPFWALLVRSGSRDVTIDGVKIIGQWRYNSDGIDISASQDVRVRNCFVRSFDDCLVVLGAYLDTRSFEAKRISFENCRLWCDWGACFKLWSQPYTNTFDSIVVRDSAILHAMSSVFQVKDTCCSENTQIRAISFENIELDIATPPLRGVIQQTDESIYPGDRPLDSLQVAYIACLAPKTDEGNQKFVPISNPVGFHSLISNVVFRQMRCWGRSMPLTARMETTCEGQQICDVTFIDCPPIACDKKGDVR